MTDATVPTSLAEAQARDTNDPLAKLRDHFVIPDGLTYLVGHSLGPTTRHALKHLDEAASGAWATDIVGSWNSADWINLPTTVGTKLSKLLGVAASSVVVCDSVSINLFKLVSALIEQTGMVRRIIVEATEFPTDQYILERLARLVGAEFIRTDSGAGAEHLFQGGVLVQSLVDYRTAAIADLKATEAIAKKSGGAVVWDLSHATGVVDLKLSDWAVRYAVGCTYKYVNGGPGAPAFIYVEPDAVDDLQTPLAGWLGHAQPFAFDPHYAPADGVKRFVAGTPPILSTAALNGALDIFDTVCLSEIHSKAQALGDMCLTAFAALGLPSSSPGVGAPRGGHVSFDHPQGYAVTQALSESGIKSDFRTPSTIRFGLSPLFLRYVDVWQALETLQNVLESEVYHEPKFQTRAEVT